jgi:opacity protein-like surface antigen
MKKILLSLFLVSPAFAAEMPLNGFVGITAGGVQLSYDDVLDTKYAPGFQGKLGVEGGLKFGDTNNVYNIGLTGFYDYVFSGDIDMNMARDMGMYWLDSMSVGYTMIGATLDNYIRIDSDNESSFYLVGGIGYASINRTITVNGFGQSATESEQAAGLTVKIGGIYNIDKNIGLTFGTRIMMPDGMTFINYEAGLRYSF